MKRFFILTSLLTFGFVIPVQGAPFFTDGFEYAPGTLITNSSGVWTTYSGTAGQIQVTEDQKVQLLLTASEDVERLAGPSLAPGDTWYYAAAVTLTDNRALEEIGTISINDTYFMNFKDNTQFNLRGRLFIKQGTDPSKFTVGITSSSSSPTQAAATWGADLDFGTEYKFVVAYTASDGEGPGTRDGFADLWVNPTSSSSTFITDSNPNANVSSDLTSPMVALALRQGTGSPTSNIPQQPSFLIDIVSIGDNFNEVYEAIGGVIVAGQPGDFDDDGDVDGRDFLIWQRGGTTPALDAGLLSDWQNNYGVGALGAFSSVPEPASLSLVAFGLGALLLGKRR